MKWLIYSVGCLFLLQVCSNRSIIASQVKVNDKIKINMATTEIGKVFSIKEHIAYAKDSVVRQQIVKNSAGHIILFAFDKDQQLKEHSAPFNALLQVVDGEALIHIAGEPHVVKNGEAIILPANIPHAVYATTAFKMLLTLVKGEN